MGRTARHGRDLAYAGQGRRRAIDRKDCATWVKVMPYWFASR